MNFFDEGENPTSAQRYVAAMFVLWVDTIDRYLGLGKGAGKTWFWARAIRYLQRRDPWAVTVFMDLPTIHRDDDTALHAVEHEDPGLGP